MKGRPLPFGESQVRRLALGGFPAPRYTKVSCRSPARSSGPSMRVTCATPAWASWGWSLLIDFAAHADMASRVQPQEQTTCQRGVSEVIEGRWLGADEGPVIPLLWRTPVLAKPLV